MSYVYTYSYPDGTPFYVGVGTGRRMNVHLCDARAGRPDCNLIKQRVINKLLRTGCVPIVKKIIDGIDREFAQLVEQEFIAKHGRRDNKTGILTNMTDGADGGLGQSKEVNARKTAKIVEWVRTKRVVDPEYRKKISDGMKRYAAEHGVSEESRAKRSAKQRGAGNHFFGKSHSPEALAKMLAANIGKKHSPESNAKRSESMKRARAARPVWSII